MILLCPRCGTPLRPRLLGEWFETNPQCQDCGVALGGTRVMLAPSPDDVEYALGDWPAGDRAKVTDLLADAGTLYRWNQGPPMVLAVAAQVEDAVDQLLDGFATRPVTDDGAGDLDGTGGADSERVQAAMADLFVAADRLQHDPSNWFFVIDVGTAGATVMSSGPPYGIAPEAWTSIQDLTSSLLATSEHNWAEDAVAADAGALRAFLVDYV